MSGEEIEGDGAWCGGSMTLTRGRRDDGHADGGHADRPARRSRASTDEDLDSVLYFALFPNALVSLHPDYVMLHTLWPRAPDRTDVICEWFFEPATIAPPRTSTPPTRSGSGTWSTARTGTSAS